MKHERELLLAIVLVGIVVLASGKVATEGVGRRHSLRRASHPVARRRGTAHHAPAHHDAPPEAAAPEAAPEPEPEVQDWPEPEPPPEDDDA